MFLRNTSQYPNDEVRKLVDFARHGFNDKRVCINVKNCKTRRYGGTAYWCIPHISNAPKSARYLITVRVGKPKDFPCTNFGSYRYKTVTEFKFNSWQECLVAVLAHELTHIRQYRCQKPRSEVECMKNEHKKLLAYRNQ